MTGPDRDEPVDELLAAAYALDGPDANRALYARWAETYESGFIADSKYVYHDQVAAVYAAIGLARVAPDDVIVDVGCGTGLAGAALRRLGTIGLDGIDISPEMLRQAARKLHLGAPVYRTLIEADLTQPLAIESHTYAGAISVGTFTHGHVGPAALAEVVRIVRPGGHAAIGINAAHFAATGFADALNVLVRVGRITDLRLTDLLIYEGADVQNPDDVARIATFRIS